MSDAYRCSANDRSGISRYPTTIAKKNIQTRYVHPLSLSAQAILHETRTLPIQNLDGLLGAIVNHQYEEFPEY